MKYLRAGLALLMLLGLFVLPASTQPARKGRSYAFLVACSNYQASQFRKLPGTVAEMRDFRKALLDSGFLAADIVFLHDDKDTLDAELRFLSHRRKIVNELDLLLSRLRPEDTLVVALNGHGLHFKADKVGYFLPADAEFEDKATMLAMDGPGGMFGKLQKCKADRKLLLVNACRNDPLAGRDFAASKVQIDDADEAKVPVGIAALYSCRAGQRSFAYDKKDKLEKSLYYHHLTQAWRGAYAREGHPVTLEDVFTEVEKRTAEDAANLHGEKQLPEARRKYDGTWVIHEPVVKPPDAKKIVKTLRPKAPAPGAVREFAAGQVWKGTLNQHKPSHAHDVHLVIVAADGKKFTAIWNSNGLSDRWTTMVGQVFAEKDGQRDVEFKFHDVRSGKIESSGEKAALKDGVLKGEFQWLRVRGQYDFELTGAEPVKTAHGLQSGQVWVGVNSSVQGKRPVNMNLEMYITRADDKSFEALRLTYKKGTKMATDAMKVTATVRQEEGVWQYRYELHQRERLTDSGQGKIDGDGLTAEYRSVRGSSGGTDKLVRKRP